MVFLRAWPRAPGRGWPPALGHARLCDALSDAVGVYGIRPQSTAASRRRETSILFQIKQSGIGAPSFWGGVLVCRVGNGMYAILQVPGGADHPPGKPGVMRRPRPPPGAACRFSRRRGRYLSSSPPHACHAHGHRPGLSLSLVAGGWVGRAVVAWEGGV